MSEYKQIAEKINEMAKKDQEIRKRVFVNGKQPTQEELKELKEIDNENYTEIKNIVTKYGLITISKFGKEASFNAWLLIQHMVHDLDLMKKYLGLMHKNLEDINIKNYAYLLDRVNMLQNKPQVYGTQLRINKETNKPEMYRLKHSIEKTNQLRNEIDLEPLEIYLKSFI